MSKHEQLKLERLKLLEKIRVLRETLHTRKQALEDIQDLKAQNIQSKRESRCKAGCQAENYTAFQQALARVSAANSCRWKKRSKMGIFVKISSIA